ncbi:MAG: ABC transporter permease [Ancrocorticia sp.]|uniref:ABC transporter permease n=1 Tax=Ancrocorticia sp. TaxID=2593684 RepID=UPI003F8FCF0B
MDWIITNHEHIRSLAGAHMGLAAPAIIAAFVLSVPIAVLANRYRRPRTAILTGTGLLYAVPSLPLFILLPLLLGTGVRSPVNVVVALTLFGLALMVRSAADALDSVPDSIKLSAAAQGYSPAGRFFAVDLPLAIPALIAGLRVMSVSTISLVTVSAVLGVSSLGSLFTDGFQRGIVPSIISGVIVTAALALIVDQLLVLAGFLLTPWHHAGKAKKASTSSKGEVAR